MALSEYEKQVLQELEAEFSRDSSEAATSASRLAAQMDKADNPRARGHFVPRYVAAGSVIAVIGLGILLAAVTLGYSLWSILLGVVGFVSMLGGIMLALHTQPSTGKKPAKAAKTPRGRSWQTFIDRQERRWDDRRHG
ncbi:DUF3040 domain-containing protein [Schaalia sp. Marseille-Q2122]|uniref:DUF3040 domain-containing protein n=1 Tax=Schaalia sp. Marseille-Q2122 TaxID=2736604 RepID=UPI00158E4851|nr:DUF3040 domain-containing protein [Schaalia sp. Marseille-Q2122]